MKKLLYIFLAGLLPFTMTSCLGPSDGGYLAVYPALYEPNLGAEYAQFPSKEYTDTYRTGVAFYALSSDGVNFEPLNNGKAVLSPEGCIKMSSPVIFRKHFGGYGLIAAADGGSSVIIFDSDDLIYFKNQRTAELNSSGISVKSLWVEKSAIGYKVYWQGGDGKSYVCSTTDFDKFSEPSETDRVKPAINAALPEYAKADEACIFKLTSEEYERISKKFGRLHSVSVEVPSITVNVGEKINLPETVDVIYSDGSVTPMAVKWDADVLDSLEKGEYTVKGRITAKSEYPAPLAECRADPYAVYDEEKGVYYFTGSNMNENSANGGGAYQSIVIRESKTIEGIKTAEETEIWTDRTLGDGTSVTGWYWAPEIHKIGGKWRIIALASVKLPFEKEASGRQCIFTCNGDDLTDPNNWEYTGYIHDAANGQALGSFDTTYFEYDGRSYYVSPKWSSIWITEVDPKNPLYPISPLVQISTADRSYETNIGAGKAGYNTLSDGRLGQSIEEAPAVLIHGDKIFISYAGCTVDMMYCVCLLYTDLDSDLSDPASWTKYPYPVLATQDLTETVRKADYFATDGTRDVTGHGDSGLLSGSEGEYSGTFGPGHNTFTVDESGNPVIIYHARDWGDEYPGAAGSNKYGLVDPGRHAYAKPVVFNCEGIPACNLTPEEYLAESLRDVEIKITVK